MFVFYCPALILDSDSSPSSPRSFFWGMAFRSQLGAECAAAAGVALLQPGSAACALTPACSDACTCARIVRVLTTHESTLMFQTRIQEHEAHPAHL